MYLGILIILIIIAVLGYFVIQHFTNSISRQFKYHFDAFKVKTNGQGEMIGLLEHDFSVSGMPIIKVKIDKKEYKLMLDSGANINLLNASVYNALDSSNIEKKASRGITSAAGELDLGFVANIEFKHKQKKFVESFEILDMEGPFSAIEAKDGVRIDGILGSTFFQKHRWTIDFENLVVWTK